MTDKIRSKISQGKYKTPYRTLFSLFIVFTLCGVWHGSTINFVVWGMFHGFMLGIECVKLEKILKKAWLPLAHVYTLLTVMISWVFFKIESFSDAIGFLQAMAGFSKGSGIEYHVSLYLNTELFLAVIGGVIFALPLSQKIKGYVENCDISRLSGKLVVTTAPLFELVALSIILIVSAACLASSTHNPFIYYKF